MKEDVKNSVAVRVDFFDQYYTVPDNVKGEVDQFINEINALGESSADVGDFENRFASSGLSDKFNTLLTKCSPRPVKMTAEQKQYSRQVGKELFMENKGEMLKDLAKDAVESAMYNIKSENIAKNRERMIAEGTFDEYTRRTNRISEVESVGKFLFNKFKKKK